MEWAQVAIRHVQYGLGTVVSCEGGFIKVRFEEGSIKNFVYPDAFEKYLRAVDPRVAAMVTGEIIMKKAEENAIEREQAAIRAAVAAARAESEGKPQRRAASARLVKAGQ